MLTQSERLVRNALLWMQALRIQVQAQIREHTLQGKGVPDLERAMEAGERAASAALSALNAKEK